jgi:asparagine N-glycosylation enzyme membrane subunit Stt3
MIRAGRLNHASRRVQAYKGDHNQAISLSQVSIAKSKQSHRVNTSKGKQDDGEIRRVWLVGITKYTTHAAEYRPTMEIVILSEQSLVQIVQVTNTTTVISVESDTCGGYT